MTNRNSKGWSTRVAACGLAACVVAAGCGKSGRVSSLDAGVADIAVGSGGGGGGGVVVADGSATDTQRGTGGRVGTGGAGGGLGGVAGDSAAPGGADGGGGTAIVGGAGGGLPAGGSGSGGRAGGAGGGQGGVAGADAGLGGLSTGGTSGMGGVGGIAGLGGSASSGRLGGSAGGGSGSAGVGDAGGRDDAGSIVADGPADSGFSVDPVQCPQVQESSVGKIAHEAYLRAHSDLTQSVTVKLRELPWDPPACAGDKSDSAQCAERDQALNTRQDLNVKQVSCVYEAFGPQGSLNFQSVYWYEPLRILTSGVPTPIGTSFSVFALWSQIEAVARHPYVEGIEPALGEAAKIGVAPPAIPTECPLANDPPDPKLVDAAAIQGQGRQPVVIELRRELLPALRPCKGGGTCDDLFASGWERTVVGRRVLTCVRSWIDSQLQGFAPDVSYSRADGIVDGPVLPPFGDSIHATLAFGLGLTWDEVTEVAKHPYVERVWTSPDLQIVTLPAGCPPDYGAPVQPRVCPTTTEAIAGKFAAASQAVWQSSTGPNEVMIAVRRGSDLCPLPACPGPAVACPELTLYNDRLLEEATASQACVRALIASIGGTASSEVFVVGDSFSATLTWPQIQTVAAHPHVGQIDSRYSTSPPPP